MLGVKVASLTFPTCFLISEHMRIQVKAHGTRLEDTVAENCLRLLSRTVQCEFG